MSATNGYDLHARDNNPGTSHRCAVCGSWHSLLAPYQCAGLPAQIQGPHPKSCDCLPCIEARFDVVRRMDRGQA